MFARNVILLMGVTGLLAMMLSTMGCSSNPPVVSADLSCIRFHHIDVTEWQVADMKKDPGQWRSLALQVKGHNDIWTTTCADEPKK